MGIKGRTCLGYFAKEGWSGILPFCAFKCPTHGIVVNYSTGYEKRLEYPKFLE